MNTTTTLKKNRPFAMAGLLILTILFILPLQVASQVQVPFLQRESVYTPGQKSWTLKGDFVMIGNTNLTLENYSEEANNAGNMIYVDIDGNPQTFNSSAATLSLPMENDAIPGCSRIVYAGLYWTGRAHDGVSPNIFDVTKEIPGDENPELISHNQTAGTNQTIDYSSYKLNITQTGNNNNGSIVYTFTAPNSDKVAFIFSYQNNQNPAISVSRNDEQASPLATLSISGTEAVLETPYVIYSKDSGITITASSFLKNATTPSPATSFAKINTTGIYYPSISFTKTFDKSVVKFKHQDATDYTTIGASSSNFTTNIYYPTDSDEYMYVGYAEVTDYVREHGIGEYTVADIALREGDGGPTGYYGGWGMIVVYENSEMNWRDISIFDGYAFVRSSNPTVTTNSYDLPVSGFNPIRSGAVNAKIGIMAGEGDAGIQGNFLEIQKRDTDEFVRLSHAGNTTNNFFNSSIVTESDERNPFLVNNTGIDIASFPLPNEGNAIINNEQNSTTFRYGTNQDLYSIFLIALSIEAYVPEQISENAINTINGVVPGEDLSVLPGQEIQFTLDIQNAGSEEVTDARVIIPIPYTAEYVSSSIEYIYDGVLGGQPYFDPSAGATGTLFVDIGDIPFLEQQGTLMARLTYTFRVTEDCFILSNPNCEPYLTINGHLRSTGVVSGTVGNSGFIQGYRQTGECESEPITEPLSILIDRHSFISSNCQPQENYTTRNFSYCNVEGETIPFADVFGFFPSGTRFYNNLDKSIEYTSGSGFPATVGVTTYYAIPPGITQCWWEFTIDVKSLTSVPTTSNVTWCQNVSATPLTAAPSESHYILYYFNTETEGTAQSSLTPQTHTTGTDSYWAAEALSAQCISTNRAEIQVTVLPAPDCAITGNEGPVCPGTTFEYQAPAGLPGYQWSVTGNATISGSSTGQTVTIIAGNNCGESFTLQLTTVNHNDCETICETEVLVEDTTNPTWNQPMPADITVECNAVPVVPASITASDNCGAATVTFKEDITAGSCAGAQTITRTWTATDPCENKIEHVQVITVENTTKPTWTSTLPANITVECDQVPEAATLTASGHCGVEVTIGFNEARADGDCPAEYTLTRTWTATDECGNYITHTQVITVENTTKPTWTSTLPANITVECDQVPEPATLTASGHCGVDVTIGFNEARTDGDCTAEYTLTRTWTATDECGNYITHTQVITVENTTKPTWTSTLPANITVECDQVPEPATLTASGHCGVEVTIGFNEARTDGDCPAEYTLTRTWTATDECGNAIEHTQVITVENNTKPTWTSTLPANITVECDQVPEPATLTASGHCGVDVTIGFNEARTDGDCPAEYTLTRTWTATDECGNYITHEQVITVENNTKPTWTSTLPANITVECDQVPEPATLTANGHCGVDVTIGFNEARTDGDCTAEYTLTRTWTATDECGNYITHTQVITVENNTKPTWTSTLPANITVECDQVPEPATLTASGHCGVEVTIGFNEARADGDCPAEYTLTRTWTATDECGNYITHEQVITVENNTKPTWTSTLPANITVECDQVPEPATLTASGHCGVDVTIGFNEARTNGDCTAEYTLTRTWTATDECGNYITHEQVITVENNTKPTWTSTLPANITVECDQVPEPATLTASGHCGVDVTIGFNEARTDGDCPAEYTLTRTWTATDACGNAIEHTQVITVENNTKPTWTSTLPANITVECDQVPEPATLTASGHCGVDVTIGFNEARTNGDCPAEYTLTRTWTATDECGNAIEHTQVITVENNTKPTWTSTLPANITVECDQVPEPATLTASGHCGVDVTIGFNEARTDGDCPAEYTLTRTWTATDECGNAIEHTQVITVENNTKPTWTSTLPANITVECDQVPEPATLTASGHCGVDVTIGFNEARTDGDCPAEYTLTRTWTATDECGNAIEHTQVITVENTTKPTWTSTLPANITVECDQVPEPATLTASGHCGIDVTIGFNEARADGDCTAEYTLTRTWTATDECGNYITHTQVITVENTTKPTWTSTLPANITVECDQVPEPATLTASGHCGVEVTIGFNEARTDGDCPGNYTLTRTWTATDNCGNKTEHVQVISVEDTTPPTFTIVPQNKTVECDGLGNQDEFEAWLANVAATDNCGDVTISYSIQKLEEGLCGATARKEVTWMATDACNNTATVSAIFTIEDTTPPTFDCPANITAGVKRGEDFAEITIDIPVVLEICGTYTLVNDFTGTADASGQFPLGITTVTYTATDECENETVCFFTVTILDDEPPVMNCPPAITVDCIDQVPAPFASYQEFVEAGGIATDNNEIDEDSFTFISETSDNLSCPETITRVYRIADDEGNTTTCEHLIVIHDQVKPVFTIVPEDKTVECDGNGNSEELQSWLKNVDATDNCGEVSIENDFTELSASCGKTGSATVTWSATDACGNKATVSATFTIEDKTPPVFTVIPEDITVECDGEGNAEALSTWLDNVQATDICGDVTIKNDFTEFSFECGKTGSVLVTWTATDACGNKATTSATFTIEDTTAPVVVCPQNITTAVKQGESFAEVTIAIPAVTEICGSYTLVNDFTGTENASGNYPLGVTTVTYTVTDACGNKTTCSFTVTVLDDEPPVMTCPPAVTVNCTGEVPAAFASYADYVEAGGTATDNNAIDKSSFALLSESTDGLSCPETITRVYQIADDAGNTTTCTHLIIIHDTQAPVFTSIPSDITVECDGQGNTDELNEWLASAAATDNCGELVITHNFSTLSSDCGATGSATVTWTATDACGNTAETSATFTITDTTPPTFTCVEPQQRVITAMASGYTAQGNEFDPTEVNDVCGNVTAAHNLQHISTHTLEGYTFLPGTTEVTWTLTDACGNSAECSFTVTVLTADLVITKTAGQETFSEEGEEIFYTLVVTNMGTAELSDILVTDPLTGLETTITNLAPGDSETFTESYITTQADVDAGQVVNTATASAEHSEAGTITSSDNAIVAYITATTPVSITVTTTDVLCFGQSTGSAQAIVQGGTEPYTITWYTDPVQYGYSATNIPAGTYVVIVEDGKSTTSETSFTINQPQEPLNITSQTADVDCNGENDGYIAIEVYGGTAPYSFLWSNGTITQNLDNLGSGTYTLTIEDAHGCSLEESFTISQPEPLTIANIDIEGVYYKNENRGSIRFDVLGGIAPYSYYWSNGYTSAGLNNIPGGDYFVEISDTKGCVLEYSFFVPWEVETEDITVPQGFSPNNDGFNDLWEIGGLQAYPQNKIQVFNRYGTLVYEATPYNNDWDGTPNRGSFYGSDGKLPSGTYYYVLTPEPGARPISGWIYIAR